jgi:hypothetical protein
MPTQPHPRQPIHLDVHGVIRFRRNAIVRFLLDQYRPGLNELAMRPFRPTDWAQFMQLLGYSVSGYQELDSVSRAIREQAITCDEYLTLRDRKKPWRRGRADVPMDRSPEG